MKSSSTKKSTGMIRIQNSFILDSQINIGGYTLQPNHTIFLLSRIDVTILHELSREKQQLVKTCILSEEII